MSRFKSARFGSTDGGLNEIVMFMKILKPSATSDYSRMVRAIEFIAGRVQEQPSLSEVAAHVHLSPFHFQRLFRRWVGLTPKRFLQVLTVERAKELLSQSKPLLDVSESLGLSSGSRLYDHFVQLEAVTPGEYKKQGRGLILDVGRHETPFGEALIVLTDRGICRLSFLDNAGDRDCLQELRAAWPYAQLRENPRRTRPLIKGIFRRERNPDKPLCKSMYGRHCYRSPRPTWSVMGISQRPWASVHRREPWDRR